MFTKIIACLLITMMMPAVVLGLTFDPYILAGTADGDVAAVKDKAEGALTESGFEVVGSYSPMGDEELGVICVTHPLLKEASGNAGGLLGFASVLRVGLDATDEGVAVSYMNPIYWGNAYYRNGFTNVVTSYVQLELALRDGLRDLVGEGVFEPYGSKKGLSAKKLRKYHYMMAMPYFDDVVVLNKGTSYEDAVSRIEANAAADPDVELVYAVKFPEEKMALFGTALTGDRGEKRFLPRVDFKEPRHVAFLPYEMLVLDGKVVMLHGKYRIALSFPDLSMGTFMKISSTPGDIAAALKKVASE